ncbi:MAG: hypothetical protein B7Z55_09025 [Planctomycetales bacterium 12-60-4]|nr:MAG: hypothetical protein B7Z55_09025 [Planctomycetales bacterium 12-60-4]
MGVITPPPRIPAQATNRVAFLRGVPVGALQGGEIIWLDKLSAAEQKRVTAALHGRDPEEIDDVHNPRRRKSRAKSPEYPSNIPRPLIS